MLMTKAGGLLTGERVEVMRLQRQYQQNSGLTLVKDCSGTSAVEFAILVLPFFLLLLAIVEVGVVFFANFSLDNATGQAARLIRTGQAQNQGLNASQFKQQICDRAGIFIDCGKLKIDVRRYQNFSGMELTEPLDEQGNLKENFGYDPGTRNDIVVVRAFYELDLVGKLPADIALSNMANGNRLLVSTAAFRNEPF